MLSKVFLQVAHLVFKMTLWFLEHRLWGWVWVQILACLVTLSKSFKISEPHFFFCEIKLQDEVRAHTLCGGLGRGCVR